MDRRRARSWRARIVGRSDELGAAAGKPGGSDARTHAPTLECRPVMETAACSRHPERPTEAPARAAPHVGVLAQGRARAARF
jgi:hypothetical protein